jgi:Sigma-70 region 2
MLKLTLRTTASHSTTKNYQGTALPGKEDLRSIDHVARQHHIGRRETHHGSKGESVFEQSSPRNFEDDVLPYLDAAYNLARWLTRNDQDAEDVVQEASLRALRFFGGFRRNNACAWFLRRN